MASRQLEQGQDTGNPDLTTVFYHMNRGEHQLANQLLDKVDTPEHNRQYLRAEMAVSRGELTEGATLLRAAVKGHPNNLVYALNSSVFGTVLKHEEFAFLHQRESKGE